MAHGANAIQRVESTKNLHKVNALWKKNILRKWFVYNTLDLKVKLQITITKKKNRKNEKHQTWTTLKRWIRQMDLLFHSNGLQIIVK